MSKQIETAEENIQKNLAEMGSKPEDVAAGLFYLYMPIFKNIVARMGKKQLQKLIINLVEYPLQDGRIRALSQAEKDLFNIGDRLLSSKYMMIFHTFNESQKVQNALTKIVEKEEVKTNG